MSTFPLYDLLYKNSPTDIDLSFSEKKEIIEIISKLDMKNIELLFALIRRHYIDNEKQSYKMMDIPYGFEKDGQIVFEIENLPIQLKHIIFKFCKLSIITEQDKE
jgi:hypothetical protein